MKEYVKSDLFRYTGEISAYNFIHEVFFCKAFRYTCLLRMCKSGGVIGFLGKILYFFARNKTIKLSYHTKIGYGLYIGHDGPIVVNPTAEIGDNVTIMQFTTIGANKGKAAIIGDNCYIGPGCCIVEDVVIGRNVTIGAGSVVVSDIPDNATVAGNPAKVIHYNHPGKYAVRRWESNNII